MNSDNTQRESAVDPVAPAAGVPRRTAVVGIGAVLVAGTGLAGCARYGDSNAPAKEGADEPAPPGGTVLGATSDIPVGGGAVFGDAKIVVTQPAAGEFKGFSAVCTHRGCLVKEVSGGTINCQCHGSKFAIADGSVANGPAPSGLAVQQLTVDGDQITLP